MSEVVVRFSNENADRMFYWLSVQTNKKAHNVQKLIRHDTI